VLALMLDNFQGVNTGWYVSTGCAQAPPDSGPCGVTNTRNYAIQGGAPETTLGMYVTSDGAVIPGYASVGYELANGSGYDLTPYQGVTFWAQGSSGIDMQMLIGSNIYTSPPIQLTATWKEYAVPWTAFTRANWLVFADGGGEPPLDLTQVEIIQFAETQAEILNYYVEDFGLY
jgi:hypothetical protein